MTCGDYCRRDTINLVLHFLDLVLRLAACRRLFLALDQLLFQVADDLRLEDSGLQLLKQCGLQRRVLDRERVRAGTTVPMLGAAVPGSPSPARDDALKTRIEAGEKRAALAREFGISRQTLYQYVPV